MEDVSYTNLWSVSTEQYPVILKCLLLSVSFIQGVNHLVFVVGCHHGGCHWFLVGAGSSFVRNTRTCDSEKKDLTMLFRAIFQYRVKMSRSFFIEWIS